MVATVLPPIMPTGVLQIGLAQETEKIFETRSVPQLKQATGVTKMVTLELKLFTFLQKI